jgi:hypothetical protein
MPRHRFVVGQWVRLVASPGLPRMVAESYRITRILPERDNSPQYRLLSQDGLHERVVTEDGVEPAEPPPAPVSRADAGEGQGPEDTTASRQ